MATSNGGDQSRKPLFFMLIHVDDPAWVFGIYGNHLVDMLEDHGIDVISGDIMAGDPALVWAKVADSTSEQFLMLPMDDRQAFGFDS